MGKDSDDHQAGACCEACRLYGDPAAAPPPRDTPALEPRRTQLKVEVYLRGRATPIAHAVPAGPLVTLGRGKQNDLVIQDGTISRRQCKFEFRDDGVWVIDIGSACGTYLDGRKVQSGRLREGSEVSMADYVVRVVPA